MPDPSSDIEQYIIQGCKKKQLRYQEMLYKEFYSYGMSISLRYTYSKEEASEVLNDSFIKAFDKIKQYNTGQSFKGWLRRIIVNTAIDYYRKNKKYHNTLSIDRAEEPEYDQRALEQLQVEDILKLLNGLPELHRLTFNLYEIEGYKHDEIAAMLKISESTSRANLTRAKQRLRELFHQEFGKQHARGIR
jgi:RNA polymerase sigma factor (sigma-70 family)